LIFKTLGLFWFVLLFICIRFNSFVFPTIFHFLSYFWYSISICLLPTLSWFTSRFMLVHLILIALLLVIESNTILFAILFFALRFASVCWGFSLWGSWFRGYMSWLPLRFLRCAAWRNWVPFRTHCWKSLYECLSKHLLHWHWLFDLELLHSTLFALIEVNIYQFSERAFEWQFFHGFWRLCPFCKLNDCNTTRLYFRFHNFCL